MNSHSYKDRGEAVNWWVLNTLPISPKWGRPDVQLGVSLWDPVTQWCQLIFSVKLLPSSVSSYPWHILSEAFFRNSLWSIILLCHGTYGNIRCSHRAASFWRHALLIQSPNIHKRFSKELLCARHDGRGRGSRNKILSLYIIGRSDVVYLWKGWWWGTECD